MQNTYDDLIAAARSLQNVELLDAVRDGSLQPTGNSLFGLSDKKADSFLSENHACLCDARRALAGHCHVPWTYSADDDNARDEDGIPLSCLAWSFALGLAVSERSGDLTEAVRFGVNIFDLSNATRRGGIISDAIGSYGIASIGFGKLRRLRTRLDFHDASLLSAELSRIDAERENWDDIVMRDARSNSRTMEARDGADSLSSPQSDIVDSEVSDEAIEPEQIEFDQQTIEFLARYVKIERIDIPDSEMPRVYQQQDDRELTLIRLLAIDSALRAYLSTHGSAPTDIHALVPEFLNTLPTDPYSGRPFSYRKTHNHYVVYSVGPHGNDHGGRFGNMLEIEAGDADFCLDFQDYSVSNTHPRKRGRFGSSLFGMLGSLIRRL